jgi:hypothetical protein
VGVGYGTFTRSGVTFQSLRLLTVALGGWSYNPTASCEVMVWADPGSLATTTGLSFDFSSSGY